MNYRPSHFSHLPEVVKNLLIINGLFFLATITLDGMGFDMYRFFGIHQFQSSDFMPHQLVTHLFMHGHFTHLFFNMFALWMFGRVLENVWGGKKFLIYYMITGLGAAAIHLCVSQYQIFELSNKFPQFLELAKEGMYNAQNLNSIRLTQLVSTPTVGASGAVFGLLLAFGILFRDTLLHLYTILLVLIVLQLLYPNISLPILPIFVILLIIGRTDNQISQIIWHTIPIKAIYFVIVYGLVELYAGLSNNPADNVAHFAHLGGMIFGFLLIKYWKRNSNTFY